MVYLKEPDASLDGVYEVGREGRMGLTASDDNVNVCACYVVRHALGDGRGKSCLRKYGNLLIGRREEKEGRNELRSEDESPYLRNERGR
jgi:hypothetical protein